ncbi:hypothetical protein Taro_036513, partial [Colocasia esculenta]|nr:hypothetical protein [Colocasia esculenta]
MFKSKGNFLRFPFIIDSFMSIACSGYMSPEYALDGVFSEKSDVFSFGVILLEIITGKRSTSFYPDSSSPSLFRYAWQMWEAGRGLELLDPSMLCSSSWVTEVLRCTQLAMLCIQEDATDRPTMSSVVFSLSSDTCTLPMPNKPAFVFGRGPKPIMPTSHGSASEASINELTGTSSMSLFVISEVHCVIYKTSFQLNFYLLSGNSYQYRLKRKLEGSPLSQFVADLH